MSTKPSLQPSPSKSERLSRAWLVAEDEVLRENAEHLTFTQIAARLGRSKSSVRNRAQKLGVLFQRAPVAVDEISDDDLVSSDVRRAIACRLHLDDLVRAYGEPRIPACSGDVVRHIIHAPVDARVTSFASLCAEA